ncbi:MAG TPA: hypothetical protein VFJ84_01730 [Candidatus Saccharimonadales bacterium]|nr:hypothetical protein [Candidatus Saccharimonadales bacterium]
MQIKDMPAAIMLIPTAKARKVDACKRSLGGLTFTALAGCGVVVKSMVLVGVRMGSSSTSMGCICSSGVSVKAGLALADSAWQGVGKVNKAARKTTAVITTRANARLYTSIKPNWVYYTLKNSLRQSVKGVYIDFYPKIW